MADPRTRDRIVEIVRQMREHTTENGCTPGEAAKFAAKCAQWIEEYQIEEAELRAEGAGDTATPEEIEVCEHTIWTGKRVFNPGMTAVVDGLSRGMSCQCVLMHKCNSDGESEAVYGVIGEVLDASYVCQIAITVVPALQTMGRLEGVEHGYEKAGLVRWLNQYLTGAGEEIRRRLREDRKDRSDAKQAVVGTGAIIVTGESLAIIKKAATEQVFKQLYPRVQKDHSQSRYDGTARERGREAGRRVGLSRVVGERGGRNLE